MRANTALPPSTQASIGLLMPGKGPVQYMEEEESQPFIVTQYMVTM